MRFSRAAIIVLLVLLTLPFVWPLLKVGYTTNMGSLEPATLVMARRVAEDGIWGWYHNWYLGFPFRFAGPPLTWWLLGFLQKINLADVLVSYRLLLFASLLAFPVSFYFLAKKIFESAIDSLDATKKRSADLKINVTSLSSPRSSLRPASAIGKTRSLLRAGLRHVFGWRQSYQSLPAFISAVALLFLPSIGYLFPKYFAVGQNFGFAPSWILGASSSRSLALALLPILLLIYWNLVAKINLRNLILAIAATAVFFLIDGVTPYSLLVGTAAILIIEGKKNFFEKLTVVSLAMLLAFLIDAFYFTPENIKLIALSPSISGIGLVSFLKIIFQAAVGLGPAILALFWLKLLDKKRSHLAFIILWLLPFLAITLLFYFSNRNFLTEYTRFLPEVEMGIALLFGLVAQKVNFQFSLLAKELARSKLFNFQFKAATRAIVILIPLVTLLYSLYNLPKRQSIFKPHADISKTVEYEIAKWLEVETRNQKPETINNKPKSELKVSSFQFPVSSSRVFLSGSTAFWLNEFAPSVWQVRGDIDQASTNRFWDRATYQIRNSSDPAETQDWLKALRVSYIVVHDNNSREYYHDFAYPAKFEQVCLEIAGPVASFPPASARSSQKSEVDQRDNVELRAVEGPSTGATRSECELVYDNGQGDRIYQLDANLASIASLKGLNNLSKFSPRDEKILLSNYVEWFAGGEKIVVKEDKSKLLINTKIDSDKVISMGVTFDSAWKAQDSFGNQLTITKDPFENMVIVPRKIGQQEITLIFSEGLDLWVGIGISLLSLFWVIFLLPKQLPKILKWVKSGWEEE